MFLVLKAFLLSAHLMARQSINLALGTGVGGSDVLISVPL